MRSPTNSPPDGKAVFITGCSSGIGRQSAITLAKRGFIVFATVRKEVDAENLRSLNLPDLVPICPLDLTDLGHISSAAKRVADELNRRERKGLYALINNAGGGSPAPVELMDLEKFGIELRARLFGSVALVQAFLPLIRQAGGRIVWIMTPAIIPTPYVTSIHACDFAVNCIARTLDIELKTWGIPNIMIKCGGIKTPAGLRTTSDVDAVLKKGPRERVILYENALRKWAKEMAKFDEKRTNPEKVAKVVLKALFAERPKRRYSVGHMAKAAGFLEAMPQSVADWILKKRF
jgi:NAD(P)-dependent dehydrogenase (short-subunit alcohol dehydrogenase family)